MNTSKLLVMAVSTLIVFSSSPILAQDGKGKAPANEAGGGGHSHFTKIPDTVDGIWTEIKKQQEKLRGVVAEKDLGEAHDHAFAIRDLVKALPAKVSAQQKADAEVGAKKITTIAAAIDKSSAAQAQKATESNVKKMDAAIKSLQAKLNPKSPKK